jgi:hypothetical protein
VAAPLATWPCREQPNLTQLAALSRASAQLERQPVTAPKARASDAECGGKGTSVVASFGHDTGRIKFPVILFGYHRPTFLLPL